MKKQLYLILIGLLPLFIHAQISDKLTISKQDINTEKVNGYDKITWKSDYTTESTHVINIYNIIGECMLKQKINNRINNISIDISNLKLGIYFINLDLNKIQTMKLIKL